MSFLDNIKAVPITDYATRSGFTLVRKGKYFSLKEHDSVIIDVEKNCFWRNSRFSKGYKDGAGSIIDFAIEFNGATDAREAMRTIAGLYGIEGEKVSNVRYEKPFVPQRERNFEKKVGEIELPEKDNNNRRVYGYLLKTRGIEHSVIKYFLGKKMLYQDKRGNCVFHTGTVFGCLRGTDTNYRFVGDLEGCDYNECFFFRGSNEAKTLIVAESVIDIMSIMSHFCREHKKYTDYCYLALAGTTKLQSVFYHLEQETKNGKPLDTVMVATDNDEAGEKAWGIINEELTEKGLKCVRFASPKGKDWNDFIVNTKP